MNKIEHIGIAVKNIEESNDLFELLLSKAPYKQETVESENVLTSFFKVGETKIELLQGLTSGEDAISKFIEKRGEGIHHIAFEVKDIKQKITEMESKGFKLITTKPKKGADNKLVAFLHPKSTNGILVELCQTLRK